MRDIPGYEGLYQANEHGEIFSPEKKAKCRGDKTRVIKALKRKPVMSGNGYYQITLSKNDFAKWWTIHRLIATTFIPNPENLPWINHKNGIKTDNRVENLEWCTPQQNCQHAFDVLKRYRVSGSTNGKSKGIINLETGVYYDTVKDACEAVDLHPITFRSRIRRGTLSMAYC